MSTNVNNVAFFGWEDKIKVESGTTHKLLKPGHGKFITTDFKRGFTKNGVTPQATITLTVTDTEGNVSDIRERFALQTNVLWKISAFFKSIGLIDPDDTGWQKLPWDQIMHKSGYCEIEQTSWTGQDGETHVSNAVKSFLFGAPAKLAASEIGTVVTENTASPDTPRNTNEYLTSIGLVG